MKATLSFSLPEEAEEHQIALNGHKYLAVLQDIDRALRDLIKHGDDPEATRAGWARDLLHRTLEENDVRIYSV